MCGICGKLNFDVQQHVSGDEITTMRDQMTHRGPDDCGCYLKGRIGLGHRRLSIIDIAGSKQPLANESKDIWIVYNGEIYNYLELKRDLESKGHIFRTHGDTETIVHLYEEYGENCLDKLQGMFAFAIWDEKKQTLFAARDRLGIKPFYYHHNSNSFIFASEIKSILKSPGFEAKINLQALGTYISYRHVYGEETLFGGVLELQPGHKLIVPGNNKMEISQYWDVNISEVQNYTEAEAEERLSALLHSAIKKRLISEVPLGAFLSGGLDSSIIVAIMAELADEPVECFSVGFLPEDESELQYGEIVAQHTGSHFNQQIVGDEDFFSLMRKLVWHNDEPITFPASIPLFVLSKFSKEKATVMLSGEGADELFAGYPQNLKAFRANQLKSFIPPFISRIAAKIKTPSQKINNALCQLNMDTAANITSSYNIYPGLLRYEVCQQIPLTAEDSFINSLCKKALTSTDNFLSSLLYFQLKTYLVALLMKQDKMSMAASIESRVPFLDHELVEFAFSLPNHYKIKGNTGKQVLRSFGQKKLPPKIISRPKAGFPVPLKAWFNKKNNPFIDTLLDKETKENSFLNYSFIKNAVNGYQRGESNMEHKIWMLLNLELWRRIFLK